jgi:hypothetical protein
MGHFLEMTHRCQQRQDRFDQRAGVPFALFAHLQVSRMPVLFLNARITEANHAVGYAVPQVLKGTAIPDMGGVTEPINNQSQMIDQQAQLAVDNPAGIYPLWSVTEAESGS